MDDQITNALTYLLDFPIIDYVGLVIPMILKRAEVSPQQFTCLRCGATWTPRNPGLVRRCGVCRSPYWDVPRHATPLGRPPMNAEKGGRIVVDEYAKHGDAVTKAAHPRFKFRRSK